MKYLSIIIPHYAETERDIFSLLSSVNNQVGVNFDDIEVIIANDGGAHQLDKTFLDMFGMDIRQVSLEKNLGPGLARQAGIDASKAEYVMFCDADDVLHSVGVLGSLIQLAQADAPDMISSSWLEELYNKETDQMVYVTHTGDNTWMHGKLIRRQFLARNNIRFDDRLRVHEDSYFLAVCASLTDRREAMNPQLITYVWRFHESSITRHNQGAYSYDSIRVFVEAIVKAHTELARRGLPKERMQELVVQFTMYLYFTFHQPSWIASPYLKPTEETFSSMIAPLWHYYTEAPAALIVRHYAAERQKHFADCIEGETLAMWIQRLGLEQNHGQAVQYYINPASPETEEHMAYVNGETSEANETGE